MRFGCRFTKIEAQSYRVVLVELPVVGASMMYWGITQCKNDNMTVLF